MKMRKNKSTSLLLDTCRRRCYTGEEWWCCIFESKVFLWGLALYDLQMGVLLNSWFSQTFENNWTLGRSNGLSQNSATGAFGVLLNTRDVITPLVTTTFGRRLANHLFNGPGLQRPRLWGRSVDRCCIRGPSGIDVSRRTSNSNDFDNSRSVVGKHIDAVWSTGFRRFRRSTQWFVL